MPSFKHILFPIDFSEQNCGIAPYVICMATQHRARVTMLHVMELPATAYPEWSGYAGGWPAYASSTDFQAIVDERNQRIESFLKSEFQNIATTRLMHEGDPARLIVEYAEKDNVDLIMMPTHGYGPFRRFLLGSVTAKVLHDVKCPVWTSAHVPDTPTQHAGYRNVLCAVDLTSKSVPLIRWASGFARDQGATLKVVHAVPAAEAQVGVDIDGGRFRAFLFDVAVRRSRNYNGKPAQMLSRCSKAVRWRLSFAGQQKRITQMLLSLAGELCRNCSDECERMSILLSARPPVL